MKPPRTRRRDFFNDNVILSLLVLDIMVLHLFAKEQCRICLFGG
jgi:hypothetical protein